METAKREMTFLLAEPERRVLTAIARRVPRALRSNHFTALGVVGAVGALAGAPLSDALRRPSHVAIARAAGLMWLTNQLQGPDIQSPA